MKTLLLHTCCGPCGFSATKFLAGETAQVDRSEGFDIKYYWYNPNIQPQDEYDRRLDVAGKLFPLTVEDNDNKQWLESIKDVSGIKNERCKECYRFRLTRTAQKARELKTDLFSTTLLISPYQYHETLKKIGEEVAEKVGAMFYYYDGRPDYYKNLNEFKKKGLYVQKYCGCLYGKKDG